MCILDLVVDPLFVTDTIDQLDSITIGADVSGGTGSYIFSWSPATDLSDSTAQFPIASPLQDATYELTIETGNCVKTVVFNIIVKEIPSPYAIPNAFSPNGDGLNDIFEIKTIGLTSVKEFRVYNRWGETLFENPNSGWDGAFENKDQPTGTYLYYVVLEHPLKQDLFFQGTFSLVK